MLSYTKATLKAKLLLWNRNSAPEYETELDEIIRSGELDLMRALDLDPLVGENDTTTSASSGEVFKPDNLLHETELWVTVASVRTPLPKRSRAWVKMMGSTPGTPLYYCELDTDRWTVGPPAADAYLIDVTGQYAPDSIVDGADSNTTWFSTVVPELLYLSCSIQANDFLKFWERKQLLLTEFAAKVAIYRGETPNNDNTQGGDSVGDRKPANPVKAPGQ
jgi:hypothetical protein